MSSRVSVVVGFIVAVVGLAIAPAAAGQGRGTLEKYTITGESAKIAQAIGGVELAGVEQTQAGITADAVLTASQRSKLAASGVQVELTRNRKGLTVSEQAARQAAGGYNVYRSWDEPGGIRDELYRVARRNPQLVKLEVLGQDPSGPRADRHEAHAGRPRRSATDRARRSSTHPTSMRASGSASR